MKIVILHNAVADSDSPSDRDVLVQAAAVEAALKSLGHSTRRLACTLNFELVEEALSADRPGEAAHLDDLARPLMAYTKDLGDVADADGAGH